MNSKQKYRTIIFYKDYFEQFFVKQNDKVKDKIIWTFDLIEELPRVPETYLRHIENTEGLYENNLKETRISTLQKIVELGFDGELLLQSNSDCEY